MRSFRKRPARRDLPGPNPVRPGRGPEKRLYDLQRRFRAVSARDDRAIKLWRYYRLGTIAALVAIVAFAVVWGLSSSPWPVTTTLRHIASAPNCGLSACAQTLTGTATILDADTILIGSERIRLQGVDAPETDQICVDSRGAVWNCGIDARNRLIRYIGSREISCAINGKDAFGRWLATCSTSEGDLGAWLVREGLGLAFIRYSTVYVAEEAIARSAQKGMPATA